MEANRERCTWPKLPRSSSTKGDFAGGPLFRRSLGALSDVSIHAPLNEQLSPDTNRRGTMTSVGSPPHTIAETR
jgi:hypothetical protein